MAVVKSVIKASLLSLYNDMKTTEYTEDQFADAMADIIRDAILSATVNAGILLTTPDTINGSTTGTGTLS
jgi:hypothetical protein